ncbi:MAG: hypothetical protein CSA42_04655 [Gammaproteobacteria bacterium]|nr:MAG: hypothetical protein CSA42_04655 [Gammaproteobacteria bacterium]
MKPSVFVESLRAACSDDINVLWQQHLDFWEGEEAGYYNDVYVIVDYIISKYKASDFKDFEKIAQVIEMGVTSDNHETSELAIIGVLEGMLFMGSHDGIRVENFKGFLGKVSYRELLVLEDYFEKIANETNFDEVSVYDRLRPYTDIESCECKDITSLVLVDMMTDNPIHCFECRKEIDSERLKIDNKLVDDIASWFSVFQSLYKLWFNSGEYEEYAKKKLIHKDSQVNIEGMLLAKRLSVYYPSYYWWFHDTDDGKSIFAQTALQS